LEQIRSFTYDATEPFLNLFRKVIPMVNLGGMGLDLTPIIALIVLGIIQRIIISILLQIIV